MRNLFCLFVLFLGLSSFKDIRKPILTEAIVLIDNPTDESIDVDLDSKSYMIKPMSSVAVTLQAGKHKLYYKGEYATFFFKPMEAEGVIINPTLSNYILYHDIQKSIEADKNGITVDSIAKREYISTYFLATSDESGDDLPLNIIEGELLLDRSKYKWDIGLDANRKLQEKYKQIAQDYTVSRRLYRLLDPIEGLKGGKYLQQTIELSSGIKNYGLLTLDAPFKDKVVLGCKPVEDYIASYEADYLVLLDSKGKQYVANYEKYFGKSIKLFSEEAISSCRSTDLLWDYSLEESVLITQGAALAKMMIARQKNVLLLDTGVKVEDVGEVRGDRGIIKHLYKD